MTKSILKEIIIILLLIFAIILLLGVLLYDYVPMNKVVPQDVKYVAAEDTKVALDEKKATDSESVVLTYEVTATDLKNYQKVNEYNAGRKNPFASIESEKASTETSDSTGSSSSGNSGQANSSSTNNSGTSSGSSSTNYYPDKGTK